MNAKPAPVTDSETAPVPDLRRVFAAPDGSGGKQVAVFLEGATLRRGRRPRVRL
ncbi:hypothetical protein [Deinococcus aquaticus]|uniref:hypothetical protein n=1 Tax=Deinococcus aquaticus TaxID=328692 RepID=UPI003621710C